MNKIRIIRDGEIIEVEEGYELQEGEEFAPEEEAKEEEEEKEEEETEEETEEDIKEELKTFITSETIKALDKELDEKAETLVDKFFEGVAKNRKIALRTDKKPKNLSDQELVRKWFHCLITRDYAGMSKLQKDYLNTGTTTQGGYLVPPAPLLAEIQRFTEEYGVARRDMRYLPFSGPGNARVIPALASSVSVFWTEEAGEKKSTKPTFGLVEQTLKKLAAIVPITEEILEDSAIDIIKLLGELFGEAIALEEDTVFFTATTTPFKGVLFADGITPVNMATGKKASDITADNLLDMIYAVPRAVRNKGKFYLHSTIFKRLQKLRTSGATGDYIVQSPVGSQPGTIWNRPYELLDVLPDDTTAVGSNPFMFYTDLGKTCVYGDKAGLKVKLLDQAIVGSAEESPSDLNLATQDMIALRIVKRVGYVPVLPSGIAVLKTAAS